MKNELARSLFLSEGRAQYDSQCKKILSHKVILAWILKYTMMEFGEYSVDEIAHCIEGRPEISEIRTNPGGTNVKCANDKTSAERIIGSANENREQGEGEIFFDIRFFVCLPENRESIHMLIDVEAQKSFYPGYQIVTRGIFYAARMISSQLGTEFSIPDYDGIKKVCSIWLCLNAPKYIGNAMTKYTIIKKDVEGQQPDIPSAYSKMEVCVVTLNEKEATDNIFLEMLNVLLSNTIPYEKKEQLLMHKFHIKMDTDLRKELNIMRNLSDYIYESGQMDEKKYVVKTMIEEGYSKESIMKIARITSEEYTEWRAEALV